MVHKETLPYDITSAESIFEYSKALLGKTLRDFVWEDYVPKKGKGSLGQMVENIYFMLETNNNPEADFSKAGMELKCTPLNKDDKDELLIKERLVCNMLILNNLSSTNDPHTHQEIRTQNTNHNDTNPWNLQTSYYLSRIPANVWNAEYHQDNVCIPVHCLGHSSDFQSSVLFLYISVP